MHISLSVLTAGLGLVTAARTATVGRQVKDHSEESAPNPIANLYPFNVTGTMNSTITVLPIPLTLARSLVPAQ